MMTEGEAMQARRYRESGWGIRRIARYMDRREKDVKLALADPGAFQTKKGADLMASFSLTAGRESGG